MEISKPPQTPAKLNNWFKELVEAFRTLNFVEGRGIRIKVIKGKAIIIETIGVGIPDAPVSGTWVLGSVNGVVEWINTTSC